MEYAKTRRIILRVSIIGIIANLVLVIAKMTLGLIFDNLSVLSDAVHSASDLVTSLFVVVAVFLSNPKRDKKHNYGHEKIEPLMVMFFAVALAGIGGYLAYQGIAGIVNPGVAEFNVYLVIVTVLSILVKEALFWYGMHYAKKTKSQMLKADAWHSRSDSLTSIAVLIGLLSSLFMSSNIIESVAVLVVSLFIFKVAFDIFRPSVHQLTDRAASDKTCDKIREIASSIEGVNGIEDLRTRIFGNKIYADLVISVDGGLQVAQAHEIATAVHDTLEATEELMIKHCTVSVVPGQKTLDNMSNIA